MLRFHSFTDARPSTAPSCVLVALTKAELEALREDSPEVAALGFGGDAVALSLIHAAAARLTPAKDGPVTIELLVPGQPAFRRLVVGLLPTYCSRNNTPSLAHSVSLIVKNNKGSGDLAVALLSGGKSELAYAQALAVGRCFPTFSFTSSARKAAAEQKPLDTVDVFCQLGDKESGELMLAEIQALVESIRLAQHLVEMPPCKMHCSYYVDRCVQLAKELESSGVTIKIIRGKELDEQGFGGLYGVGKASEHDPALVILSHPGGGGAEAAAGKAIALVGKGIVYDTGGLSIKVPPGMVGMKDDMGGSAAVLGAFSALVKTGGLPSKRPLHALLCIAENSVDSKAMRPDDILFLLSGKTVEVNNTDAEGRLVLADGVHYSASRLDPELIVDIATLTGAQLITTGKKHAAVYCSHEELEDLAVASGKATGDLTFPMLYAPEFHRLEFKSAVADGKNSVADRMNAQSSCAAQFIANNIEDYLEAGGKWVHVDMAGPVNHGDRATGYGVALLFDMARRFN